MGAGLTIIAILGISVLVVRIGAVAFQQTGLSEDIARFQALSVFTGCGFTTSESEMIVNYPLRRKIAVALMVIGNIGLVGILSTLVVSLVATDGSSGAITRQVIWLAGGAALIWICLFSKRIDRIMCRLIGTGLRRTTSLGQRQFNRQLQIADGYSICEHILTKTHLQKIDQDDWLTDAGFTVLAVHHSESGERRLPAPGTLENLAPGDKLILSGAESAHEEFSP